jgi:hypothetical protein
VSTKGRFRTLSETYGTLLEPVRFPWRYYSKPSGAFPLSHPGQLCIEGLQLAASFSQFFADGIGRLLEAG